MLISMTPLELAITEQGLRKDWIADQLGVSKSALSKWLSGERSPSAENQKALALLLRRKPEELFPTPEATAA